MQGVRWIPIATMGCVPTPQGSAPGARRVAREVGKKPQPKTQHTHTSHACPMLGNQEFAWPAAGLHAADFEFDKLLYEGENGAILLARCIRPDNPTPSKEFQVKIAYAIRNGRIALSGCDTPFEDEVRLYAQVEGAAPMEHLWGAFVDEVPPAVDVLLPMDIVAALHRDPVEDRARTGFSVFDYNDRNLEAMRGGPGAVVPFPHLLAVGQKLFELSAALSARKLVHKDWKLSSIRVCANGDLVLGDWSCGAIAVRGGACAWARAALCRPLPAPDTRVPRVSCVFL